MNLKRNNIDLDNKLIIAETVKNLKNGVSKSLAMNTLKRAKQYCNSKQMLITEMLPTDIDNLSMNSQDKKVLNTALSIRQIKDDNKEIFLEKEYLNYLRDNYDDEFTILSLLFRYLFNANTNEISYFKKRHIREDLNLIELNNGNKERRYLYISNDMIKELFKFYDSSKKISIIEEDNIHSGDGIINYINNISKLMANDIDCAIEIGYMEYYDRKPSEAEKSKIKNDLIERMNKVEDKGI